MKGSQVELLLFLFTIPKARHTILFVALFFTSKTQTKNKQSQPFINIQQTLY